MDNVGNVIIMIDFINVTINFIEHCHIVVVINLIADFLVYYFRIINSRLIVVEVKLN